MVLSKIDALGADLERRGLSRGFPILNTVTAALGARYAGVFTGIVQQVPSGTVNALEGDGEPRRRQPDRLL
jgi:hypothetical protein